jgi:bacterioferritin (cytochrome b1)
MKTELTKQELLINRTGIMTHAELAAELIQGAKEAEPSSEGDLSELAENRAEYLEQAPPIGSKPMPVADEETMNEREEGGALEPQALPLLLDKLGERLAFERQGTRLYEAVLQKCELLGEQDVGPTLAELRHIHEQEMEHFKLLQRVITDMGGDATVQTPSADIAGVLSLGILQVVSDPRTTMAQTLQAMLTAELADNDGWEMLITLANGLGASDYQNQFEQALESEREHLDNVRAWLEEMTLKEASLMPGDGVAAGGAARKSRGGKNKSSGGRRRKKK